MELRLCTDNMFRVCFMLYLQYIVFCKYLAAEDGAGCITLSVFSDVVWFYFSVSLPRGTVGWIVAFPRHTHLPYAFLQANLCRFAVVVFFVIKPCLI